MSSDVKWMAARADGDLGKDVAAVLIEVNERLGAHTFPPTIVAGVEIEIAAQRDWQSDPDIWLYRKKT
ncbi:MAG: hypothetical protein WB814_10025, partial [Candidatus Sulfotelmatobacter sp.]